MKGLRRALERHGWDGDWYRRAFFDDGTPLGSAINAECRIDSIAQSWSVLSGAANPPHAIRAMAAVEEYLVRRGDGLVLLFTPPFDRTATSIRATSAATCRACARTAGSTPTARSGRPRLRRAGRGRQGGRAVLDPQPDQPRRAPGRASTATRSSRTSWPRTSTRSRRTSAAAAGPGTRDRRAGCTRPASSRSSGSGFAAPPCRSNRASRGPGRASRSTFAYHSARYEIAVENPHGVSRGVSSAELDGQPLAGPGADDPARRRRADPPRDHRPRLTARTVLLRRRPARSVACRVARTAPPPSPGSLAGRPPATRRTGSTPGGPADAG